MTYLDPARLDGRTPDAAFRLAAQTRRRAFDRRFDALEEARYADPLAVADREVLGIPDRRALALANHVRPLNQTGVQWGAMAAAFQTMLEDFARAFSQGWNAIRPNDPR